MSQNLFTKKEPGLCYKLRGYLYIAPAMLLLLIITIYPVIRTVVLSLSEFNFIEKSFTDSWFKVSFWNTFLFTVASVALHFLVSWVLALIINPTWRFKWLRNTVRGLWILPWLFSTAAAALMWGLLFHPFGFLNYFLVNSGLISKNIDFLGDPNIALWSLVIVNVWKTYPIYLVLLLGALQAISEELIEAARLDGANNFQVLWHVIIPKVMPTVLTLTTLDFITTFGHFDLVRMMTGGGPLRATETLSYYIYRTAFRSADFSYSAVISVAMFAFLTIFCLIYVKLYARCED